MNYGVQQTKFKHNIFGEWLMFYYISTTFNISYEIMLKAAMFSHLKGHHYTFPQLGYKGAIPLRSHDQCNIWYDYLFFLPSRRCACISLSHFCWIYSYIFLLWNLSHLNAAKNVNLWTNCPITNYWAVMTTKAAYFVP